MDKVRVIEKTLACYRCGWASLIPVIGFVFVHLALVRWTDAREASAGDWNPAARYLWLGFSLTIFGAIISLGSVALIGMTVLDLNPFFSLSE